MAIEPTGQTPTQCTHGAPCARLSWTGGDSIMALLGWNLLHELDARLERRRRVLLDLDLADRLR